MTKNLSEAIRRNADKTAAALTTRLPDKGRPYEILLDAMRYSACAGGKRVRPFLTLEVCAMLGGREEAALPYAAAVEMIHTYSLIHDDLPCMDNDDFRRGKPTNHKKFGEATALLAGDALLTYAFETAAGNTACTAEQNLEAVGLLARNAGFDGMVGGQMLDLLGEKSPLPREDFLLMNRLKTGCLIRAAALLGAIAAGCLPGSGEWEAIDRYAGNVGLAFQIEDDLLDAGTEDQKSTFLRFMTADEAQKTIASLTKEASAQLAPFPAHELLTDFASHLASRTV